MGRKKDAYIDSRLVSFPISLGIEPVSLLFCRALPRENYGLIREDDRRNQKVERRYM